jgi:superfamily II DNA/RNA helicase
MRQACYRSFSSDDFGLKDELLRGIFVQDFEQPTEVQQNIYELLKTGRDVVFKHTYRGER